MKAQMPSRTIGLIVSLQINLGSCIIRPIARKPVPKTLLLGWARLELGEEPVFSATYYPASILALARRSQEAKHLTAGGSSLLPVRPELLQWQAATPRCRRTPRRDSWQPNCKRSWMVTVKLPHPLPLPSLFSVYSRTKPVIFPLSVPKSGRVGWDVRRKNLQDVVT